MLLSDGRNPLPLRDHAMTHAPLDTHRPLMLKDDALLIRRADAPTSITSGDLGSEGVIVTEETAQRPSCAETLILKMYWNAKVSE